MSRYRYQKVREEDEDALHWRRGPILENDFLIFPGSISDCEQFLGTRLSYIRLQPPHTGIFIDEYYCRPYFNLHDQVDGIEGIVGIVNASPVRFRVMHRVKGRTAVISGVNGEYEAPAWEHERRVPWWPMFDDPIVQYFGMPIRIDDQPPFR